MHISYFTYVFETLTLKSADWDPTNVNLSNCNAVTGTRCWGETTAAKYYPGIAPSNSFTSPGLVSDFRRAGCYDYLISNFSGNNGLTFAPGVSTVVTNINDGSGAGINNRNHGTYQYTYTPPASAITMPTANCGLTIINSAHGINGGLRPSINIIMVDNNPSQYLQNLWTMWFGVSAAGDTGISTQSAEAVQHTSQVAAVLAANGITPPVNKWFGTAQNATPTGLPIFMRIAVSKWTGAGYSAPIYPSVTANASVGIIDVTPYWLGLPGITGAGFQLNVPAYGFNIGLRDKITITFTGGIENDGSNPNYLPLGVSGVGVGTVVPSSVTIDQDPFTGIFPDVLPAPNLQTGPFSITGSSPKSATGVSYTNATGGWQYNSLPVDDRFGVPLNNLAQPPVPSTRAAAYNQPCEFVVTGDMTITWSVG